MRVLQQNDQNLARHNTVPFSLIRSTITASVSRPRAGGGEAGLDPLQIRHWFQFSGPVIGDSEYSWWQPTGELITQVSRLGVRVGSQWLWFYVHLRWIGWTPTMTTSWRQQHRHCIGKLSSSSSLLTYTCIFNKNHNKSVVFLAGAALDLVHSQRGRDYNGNIYCMTPTHYGGRYITWHLDNRLTSHCLCASLLGTVWLAGGTR